MTTLDYIKDRAKAAQARIVLPEGDDPRLVEAANRLLAEGLAQPILLVSADADRSAIADGVTVINPDTYAEIDAYAESFYQLRKHKGISLEDAQTHVRNPLVFGALMLRLGDADGCVAGAVNATSNVLRAGLQVIGMAEGVSIASSTFLMILPDGRAITYGDCGMVPDPNAEQLATIAVSSAHTHRQLTGEDPVVAMLSFSTKGSAKSPSVEKVQEATALAQAAAPEIAIDGELQFDAAWIPAIGQRKAPSSPVPGNANVFIFPNLDAGNIAYKITERLGNAQALGPLIQGLAKPMHDLSRGCSADDVVVVSCIAAVQASA